MLNQFILGQEVIVPEYGLGRVTAICSENDLDGNPKWIQVKPYVAGYDMQFDPHNVQKLEIRYARFS